MLWIEKEDDANDTRRTASPGCDTPGSLTHTPSIAERSWAKDAAARGVTYSLAPQARDMSSLGRHGVSVSARSAVQGDGCAASSQSAGGEAMVTLGRVKVVRDEEVEVEEEVTMVVLVAKAEFEEEW